MIELLDDIQANRDVKRSLNHASRHYKENASAYHEQAVKDAEADGATISFSGDTAKHVIKQ